MKDIKTSLQETKTYDLSILNDKLVFDVTEFDQEPYGYKDVFSFVIVKYNTVCKKSLNNTFYC